MSGNNRFILVAVFVFACLFGGTTPAQAQTPAPQKDDSCIACHENLYLLHDTGKWYCLCGIAASCIDCHGGVAGAVTEEAAHQSMIAAPTHDEAARCQGCHPQDYSERVAKFAALGGIRATPPPAAPYQPAHDAQTQPAADLQPQPAPLWRILGLSASALSFIGLIFFAVRCYQHDCIIRKKESLV